VDVKKIFIRIGNFVLIAEKRIIVLLKKNLFLKNNKLKNLKRFMMKY
jgi:hypothetical protein